MSLVRSGVHCLIFLTMIMHQSPNSFLDSSKRGWHDSPNILFLDKYSVNGLFIRRHM